MEWAGVAKRGGKNADDVFEGGGYCEGRRLRRSRPESEAALLRKWWFGLKKKTFKRWVWLCAPVATAVW